MVIDTEIRLQGDDATVFCNMLKDADLSSINARDDFLSNLSCYFDEEGVMSVDVSDLNIDLGVLNETICEINIEPTSKDDTYVDSDRNVRVDFDSRTSSRNEFINDVSYTNDRYYYDADGADLNDSDRIEYDILDEEYSVSQNASILYAA
jgi:hypothetical protein